MQRSVGTSPRFDEGRQKKECANTHNSTFDAAEGHALLTLRKQDHVTTGTEHNTKTTPSNSICFHGNIFFIPILHLFFLIRFDSVTSKPKKMIRSICREARGTFIFSSGDTSAFTSKTKRSAHLHIVKMSSARSSHMLHGDPCKEGRGIAADSADRRGSGSGVPSSCPPSISAC